jgi:hypothetical protein
VKNKALYLEALAWIVCAIIVIVTVFGLTTSPSRAEDDPYLDLPVSPYDPPAIMKTATITTKPPAVIIQPRPPKAPPPVVSEAPLPPPTPPPMIFGHDLYAESGSIVYVIDVSGSMNNLIDANTTRLGQAKTELTKSITSLPKSFKFNIIGYDCYVYQWSVPLQPADDSHKAEAAYWVNHNLTANGGTGTGPAVSLALEERSNKLVVLLTDGCPNCGAGSEDDNDPQCRAAHLRQIHNSNQQRARIDVFGIGAVGDFKAFCVAVASQNGGSYIDVR